MAYKNLEALALSNSAQTYRHFRDFMCARDGSSRGSANYAIGGGGLEGIGWTLVDQYCFNGGVDHYYDNTGDSVTTSNANYLLSDYFVMYSPGEDGDRDLYFKVIYMDAGFYIHGFLYWNSTTHAGTQQYGSAGTPIWTVTSATNNTLWVYGSLDHFVGISKNNVNSTYYSGVGGWMPDSIISTEVTVAANAITANGTNDVTVTMPAVPAEWAIGTKLFVRDTVNIEQVTITNISGNDVTFDFFVASYLAGAKFCLEITNYTTFSNGNAVSTVTMQISKAGASGTKADPLTTILPTIYPTAADADTGYYPCYPIYVGGAGVRMGPFPNIYQTQSTFTSESAHTIGAQGYRFFNRYSAGYIIIKKV